MRNRSIKETQQNDFVERAVEEAGRKTVAVLFPGMGYHQDKPLLYYAAKLLAQRKIPVIRADYGPLPSGKENLAKAVFQVQMSVELLASKEDWRRYDRLILVGKSVGTVAAGYFEQTLLNRGVTAEFLQIAYTPVNETLPFLSEHSIVFSGTADPMVDGEQLALACLESQAELHTFQAANHSLETGEALRDLEIVRNVMEATDRRLK